MGMDSFMFCWASMHRLRETLNAIKTDGTLLWPVEDAPPYPFDDEPSDYDEFLRVCFKLVREMELQTVNEIGLDALLTHVDQFFGTAAELGCSWYGTFASNSSLDQLYDDVPPSTYDRQLCIANALRDARGFCSEFSGRQFPSGVSAGLIEEARMRAAEADVLWNEWSPSSSQLAHVAIVLEIGPSSTPTILRCKRPNEEYSSREISDDGGVKEHCIRRAHAAEDGNEGLQYWMRDSDWARLVCISRGTHPLSVESDQRWHVESTLHFYSTFGEDVPLIPGLFELEHSAHWPLTVRAATATEARQLLRSASG